MFLLITVGAQRRFTCSPNHIQEGCSCHGADQAWETNVSRQPFMMSAAAERHLNLFMKSSVVAWDQGTSELFAMFYVIKWRKGTLGRRGANERSEESTSVGATNLYDHTAAFESILPPWLFIIRKCRLERKPKIDISSKSSLEGQHLVTRVKLNRRPKAAIFLVF